MKTWNMRESISETDSEIFTLYPEIVSKMLFYRGIKTEAEADRFFNPDYKKDFHDPFLMSDMLKASLRIIDAISKKEKIAIYGDYDCDGIPGSAILSDFFKKIGFNNFEVYIPHRHSEGYGMNLEAVRVLAMRGVDLIITVDSGRTDHEPINEARALGVDVIVTDHHEPKETLPNAYAVLNPKRADDTYPYKHLSGSGVAFKLVQALLSLGNFGVNDGWEKWLLDLAGMATIADMVPLHGENRAIAKLGLTVLRKTRRLGLLSLFKKQRINASSLTEEDIGFAIAPRINAASRMGTPFVAFKFISSGDEEESRNAYEYLERKNDERKKAVDEILKNSKIIVEEKGGCDVLVIGHESWIPGLAGLIAGRLAESHKKTVFVWGKEGSAEIKGSCRSDGSVSIVKLMSAIPPEILLEFGGHHMAGGFSLAEGTAIQFEDKINEVYRGMKEAGVEEDTENIPKLDIDNLLGLDEVNWSFYRILEKMAPFGMGNPKPIFLFKNVEIGSVKKFGKKGDHFQIDLVKDGGGTISAYNFFIDDNSFENVELSPGKFINLAASIEKNNFGRSPTLRLRIADIQNP